MKNKKAAQASGGTGAVMKTALGDELHAVIHAHADLCKAAAERAGAAGTQSLGAVISDADFIMRQYLAYVRTFVEPLVAAAANAVFAAAEAAKTAKPEAAPVPDGEPVLSQETKWPPEGFEKKPE